MVVVLKPLDEIQVKPRPMFPESRALLDWISLRLSPVYYGINVPRGNGSAVILIPGFLGTDYSLLDLNLWLKRIGYRSYMSGIGFNADCFNILDGRLSKTVDRAYQETGRKVHLIGQSLGGNLGLSAAVNKPDKIAQVITLGSPLRGITVNQWVMLTASVVRLSIFLRHFRSDLPRNCYTPACKCAPVQRLRTKHIPSSVKKVAVFTQDDGIVDWRYCIYGDPRLDRKVHGGTHVSLAFHSESFRIIGEELARCEVEERAVA